MNINIKITYNIKIHYKNNNILKIKYKLKD